ncbi:polyamine-modulated factor 1 isoform X3 [Nannospalax galili]|uniref:polyamine-modulated factor 1 isoform X3 n=1 Tax=Nannospalax galili TaxID=1026970 RepID=UPI0004ED47C4|nr:polyamine-modulated factor 1 isoform X3 [Nannospalax galili]
MAEASNEEASAEKRPEDSAPESVPLDATVSRVNLLDTLVDTFLQKLVSAESYQRFTDCYNHFHQLQPQMTQRVYDKFVTQLQTSIREEISEIKEEGNLEAVLNSLDKIIEEGKNHKEPACSGIPCNIMYRNRRPRTRNWPVLSWQDAGRWKSCSNKCSPVSRCGRLYTKNRGSCCHC